MCTLILVLVMMLRGGSLASFLVCALPARAMYFKYKLVIAQTQFRVSCLANAELILSTCAVLRIGDYCEWY